MNLSHLLLAGAAAVSLGAVAAEQSKQEPRSQSGQSESQSAATGTSAQTPAQTGQSRQQASQSSDTIKQAQEKLSAQGLDAGPADGKLGAKTQAAVKQFQQTKGLKASGQLDQPTLAALGVGAEGAASTGASSAASGASGQSSTGATKSPEQSSSGSSAGSSAEPKAQEQPKEKSQ